MVLLVLVLYNFVWLFVSVRDLIEIPVLAFSWGFLFVVEHCELEHKSKIKKSVKRPQGARGDFFVQLPLSGWPSSRNESDGNPFTL